MSTANVICLLPVRNGEVDLPGYLESVGRFADAVLALDDGSTDRTRAILESSPLVKLILSNPPRPSYEGWDDSANRNRLLAVAADFAPDWIISLDADERIPADDAAALRDFIETEALPQCAYGFQIFRMHESIDHYVLDGLWIFRLFAYQPGQRFPNPRLHFVPIPTSIPEQMWLRTTIRIQHLAGLSDERRQHRFNKYREADPDHAFQFSYHDLLKPPGESRPWEPRRPGLPFLDVGADELAVAREDAEHPALADIHDRPALSAIIISRDDGAKILRTVASVVNQECPWSFEVIVVTSGTGGAAQLVREQFPGVTVVDLPTPALPGVARNAGLAVARGDYISFPGSHVELLPGSFAARLRAHDLGYTMVTGTVINGTRTRAGWASYFLDQSAILPGRPSTELTGAPSHCSYRRSALVAVGGFPEDMRAGEDTVVNQELANLGHRAYRAQDVTLIHHSPCRTGRRLIRHHFTRGRGYGRIIRDRDGVRRRMLVSQFGLLLVIRMTIRRLWAIRKDVRRWGDAALTTEYRRSRPLIAAAAVASYAGAVFEVVRPRANDQNTLSNRPHHREITQ